MTILLILSKFLITLFGFVYLPGLFIVKLFCKNEGSKFNTSVMSLVVGILVVTETYNLLGMAKGEIFFPLIILVFASMGIVIRLFRREKMQEAERYVSQSDKRLFYRWLFILIFIELLLIASTGWFKSGLWYEDGLRFYCPTYDATCYLSIIGEMSKPMPYQYPNFAGELLTGYHYGHHQFTSIIGSLSGIEAVDLFFRLIPFFLIPLTMLIVFITVKEISQNLTLALTAVIFIFFISDFSWFINIFLKMALPVVQLNFIIHPVSIFGTILFLTGLYFMERKNIILTGLTWGLSFKFAAFYSPVILVSLLIAVFVTNRKRIIFKFLIATLLVSVYSYFQVSKLGQAMLFKFYPGYFWMEMISRLFSIKLTGSRLFSLSPVRLIGVFLLGFFVYNFILFGIKIIAIPEVLRRLNLKKLSAADSLSYLFCQIAMILSFLATNMFIRTTRGIHNTEFFLEPFLLVLNIYASMAIIKIFSKINFKKVCLLLVLIIFGFGGSVRNLGYILNRKYMLISHEEYEGIVFLKKVMLPQDIVMHFRPHMPWYNEGQMEKVGESHRHRQLFISTLTQRRVLLEGASLVIENGAIENIWDKLREREHIDLIETKDWRDAKKKIERFSIDFIWLGGNEEFNFEWEKILKKSFSNGQINIFEVIYK